MILLFKYQKLIIQFQLMELLLLQINQPVKVIKEHYIIDMEYVILIQIQVIVILYQDIKIIVLMEI